MIDNIRKLAEIVLLVFIIAFIVRYCNSEPETITETITVTDTVYVTVTDTQFVSLPAVVDTVYLDQGGTVIKDITSSQTFTFQDSIYTATFDVVYHHLAERFDVDFNIDIKLPIVTETTTHTVTQTPKTAVLTPIVGLGMLRADESNIFQLNAGFGVLNRIDVLLTVNERLNAGFVINFRF